MLKFLRKKTKAIIWTVVIAFVAWGGYAVGIQFQEASRSPGRIFGKEVSFRDYLMASRIVQILNPPSDKENQPTLEEVEARTWEFLVLSREAKTQKVEVSDEEVRQEIRHLFGVEESPFTKDQYLQWVRSVFREEPREFEGRIREYLRIQKLLKKVKEGMKENTEENFKRWYLDLIARANIQAYQSTS